MIHCRGTRPNRQNSLPIRPRVWTPSQSTAELPRDYRGPVLQVTEVTGSPSLTRIVGNRANRRAYNRWRSWTRGLARHIRIAISPEFAPPPTTKFLINRTHTRSTNSFDLYLLHFRTQITQQVPSKIMNRTFATEVRSSPTPLQSSCIPDLLRRASSFRG